MKKIAIISSHPIQYYAPLFALMAKQSDIELMVFYTWGLKSLGAKYDPDFGKTIEWDIPLLEGYSYKFVDNTSKNPGSHHFKGIINPSLNQEIEHWGAEIVWIWGWSFDSHLKAMRYFKGKIPVWFRGDSTLIDEPIGFSIKKMARRLFLTWVYKCVDKAFYVGTNNRKYFEKHGLTESQLVYAPHSIDINRFTDEQGLKIKKARQWRIDLGIHDEDKVLLFAGKMETKKNPGYLIELSKKIRDKKIKFLMVGNGDLENELKKETDGDSRFIFLDFQNQTQMPYLYRMANYFILPSIGPNETWGLAINEALASGVPVLVSQFCGGAIDLINENNGLIFNPKVESSFTQLSHQIKNIFFKDDENNNLLKGHTFEEVIMAINLELDK